VDDARTTPTTLGPSPSAIILPTPLHRAKKDTDGQDEGSPRAGGSYKQILIPKERIDSGLLGSNAGGSSRTDARDEIHSQPGHLFAVGDSIWTAAKRVDTEAY